MKISIIKNQELYRGTNFDRQSQLDNSISEIKAINSRLNNAKKKPNTRSIWQYNAKSPIRAAERKTGEKKKNETSIQNLWDQKCALKNYGWKIPKAKEGNVYSGTGSTECPK